MGFGKKLIAARCVILRVSDFLWARGSIRYDLLLSPDGRITLSNTIRFFACSLVAVVAIVCLSNWRTPTLKAASALATKDATQAMQWRQLPGPGRVTVRAFLGRGQYLFAASDAGGVFRSANNGENWIRINNGLTPRVGEKVYALAAIGMTIFAGTADGVFRSTDNGGVWAKASTGLPNSPTTSLVVSGATIFAGTTGAVFRSTNNGDNWEATGALQTGNDVVSLAANGTTIFACTMGGGVFRSVNNGDAWIAANMGLTNLNVTAIGVAEANLFAATLGGGVFLSANSGDSWLAVNTGLANPNARAIAVIGSILMVGTDDGVFRSADNGQNWATVSTGLTARAVKSLGAVGTTLYVGTNDGAFRSTNEGANWTGINAGLSNLSISSFAAIGSKIFAATNGFVETDSSGKILSGGVYVTDDGGQSWRAVNNGLIDPYVGGFVAVGTTLFAATNFGVCRSTDLGESWKVVLGPGLDIPGGMVASGTTLYLRSTFGLSRSTDNGDTWVGIRSLFRERALGASNTAVFLGNDDGEILRSIDNGQSWQQVYKPTTVNSSNRFISSFAASGRILLAASANDGVLLTTDNGASWRPIGTGLPPNQVISLVAINGKDFYAATNNKVFLSTNQGASWEAASDELTPERLTALAVIGSKLFAGTGVKEVVSGGSELGGIGALAGDLSNGAVANVSAASYFGDELASESISVAFGINLATQTQAATSSPLPTDLAGTKVMVKDGAGIERLAPLFFVSPTQINYQMPANTTNGLAAITVVSGDGKISGGLTRVSNTAPGIFSADASGQGIAAAVIFRIKADGSQVYEPIVRFDTTLGRFIPIPIDLGPESEQVFLILFGTGFRYRSALSTVSASIGGANAEVIYAGITPDFVGLDQANIRLPRSLIGRGDVLIEFIVEGKRSNTVTCNIR